MARNGTDAAMNQDIYEIRKKNLETLVKRFKSRAELARLVGSDPAYFNQILNPKINARLGSRLARQIERALDLEEGWLDMASVETTSDPQLMELLTKWPQLTRETRNNIMAIVSFGERPQEGSYYNWEVGLESPESDQKNLFSRRPKQKTTDDTGSEK